MVVLTSNLLSVIVGSMVSFGMSGGRALRDCFAPQNVIPILPVAACFSLAELGRLQASPYFDAASIKLLGQMKLPLLALLSSVVLGRRYSAVQWQTLFLICVACGSFTVLVLPDASRAGKAGQVSWVGLRCICTWVVCNVLGTTFAERAYKAETKGLSFASVMTNIRIGEVATTIVLLCCEKSFHPRQLFSAWDRSTLLVAFTLVCDAWFSGLVVKNLSSVTQKVAKCASLVVLYILALCTGTKLVLVQALGAMLIVQSTALFATATVKAPAAAK